MFPHLVNFTLQAIHRLPNIYRLTERKRFTILQIWYAYIITRFHSKNEQDNTTVAATNSIKINRPGFNIHMYWANFWRPTIHIQQNIFEKTLQEVGRSHIYASFGNFCVQIDQLFEAQRVSEKCMKTVIIAVFEGKWRRFRILSKV